MCTGRKMSDTLLSVKKLYFRKPIFFYLFAIVGIQYIWKIISQQVRLFLNENKAFEL